MSSVTIQGLQVGQRYCVQNQFFLYSRPVGPRSCSYCELIPESSKNFCPRLCCDAGLRFLSPPGLKSNKAWIIAVVLLVLIPALLTPTIVYMFMYRCGTFKRWLHSTRYSIPAHVSPHTHTRTHTFTGVTVSPASSSSRICHVRVIFASPAAILKSATTR